jgi:hypothetical protein
MLQLSGVGVTCDRHTLHINILRKAAVLHFALTTFCSWGLCQSQPANMAVLMSSFHRLLILLSLQSPATIGRREVHPSGSVSLYLTQ